MIERAAQDFHSPIERLKLLGRCFFKVGCKLRDAEFAGSA